MSYPRIPRCDDFTCLNGPLTNIGTPEKPKLFETYGLCEACQKAAPDPYKYGVIEPPPSWSPRVDARGRPLQKLAADIKSEKAQRKSKAISYLSIVCMNERRALTL